MKLGDYFVNKMIKGYKKDRNLRESDEVSAEDMQNLIKSKNLFVLRHRKEEEAKKKSRFKAFQKKDSTNEMIKKITSKIEDNLKLVQQIETVQRYRIKKSFNIKYKRRKGTAPVRQNQSFQLRTRPENYNSQSRFNILNRKIFQNIHGGIGFYPRNTKISNCSFQPQYKQLILEKANRNFGFEDNRKKQKDSVN